MARMTRRFALAAFAAGALLATPAQAQWQEWEADDELGFVIGAPDAPVTIVEYFSPTCSHCAEFDADVLAEVRADYVDTGKVRLVMREYIRNDADTVIITQARCLGNDAGVAFIEDVFADQDAVIAAANAGKLPGKLIEIATPHGLTDRAAFDACHSDLDIRFDMVDVQQSASHYRVRLTPTFIADGKVKPGDHDTSSPEAFSAFLDKLLAKTAPATN
ncbi:MAG: thioredoxin domain-containing protein [Hyphomonas sp.]|nr:thioredoxin domain-containing protein [Hyphomonas sp.]